MKPFNHFDAGSVDDALKLLKEYNGRAMVTAGGTDLLGTLKSEILPNYPQAVINLKTIPAMGEIESDHRAVWIGATARLTDIIESPMVNERFSVLVQAAESVGSPELRNMGTIGGNLCQDTRCWYYRYPDKMGGQILCYRKGKGPCHAVKGDNRYHAVLEGRKCHAVCPSDLAIALTALQAEVETMRPAGGRMIPLCKFYHTLGTVLEADELVTRIRIPNTAKNSVQRFIKFRLRESIDFAVVSVAAVLDMNDDICQDAAIVLGAVSPTPYRAEAAENILKAGSLNNDSAVLAAEAALQGAKPMSRNAYKIKIAKTLVERTLKL